MKESLLSGEVLLIKSHKRLCPCIVTGDSFCLSHRKNPLMHTTGQLKSSSLSGLQGSH